LRNASCCYKTRRTTKDWDNLSGDAKSGKARALVRHCEKHDQLPQLQQAMRLARPNLQHDI
jgi:hypothetical protein